MNTEIYGNCCLQEGNEANREKFSVEKCTCLSPDECGNLFKGHSISQFEEEIKEDIGEKIYSYLREFPFICENKIVYLSPKWNYFYSSVDFKDIDVIVNFRLSDKRSQLRDVLIKMHKLLPENGYYVGRYKRHPFYSRKGTIGDWITTRKFLPRVLSEFTKYIIFKKADFLFHIIDFTLVDLRQIEGSYYFIVSKSPLMQKDLPAENKVEDIAVQV